MFEGEGAFSGEKAFKGEKTLFILERIREGVMHFSDLTIATLITAKGQQGKIEYRARLIKEGREKLARINKQKRKFNKLIYKLKKDGLIQVNSSKWKLTQKGLEKLSELKERIFKGKNYIKENGDTVSIFTFDIPQKLNRHREWLRDVLKNLGFRMLQRSVWISRIKIPKDFVDDLNKLGLMDHIEIVSVAKSGTLKDFVK